MRNAAAMILFLAAGCRLYLGEEEGAAAPDGPSVDAGAPPDAAPPAIDAAAPVPDAAVPEGQGPARVISGTTSACCEPDLAIAPSGDATVVWVTWGLPESHTSAIWSSRRVDGQWGTPERISDFESRVATPRVAVDPAGNVTAIWPSTTDHFWRHLWANRYVRGVGWGTPTRLDDGAIAVDSYNHDVEMDPAGNVMVVWNQLNGSGGTWDILARRFTPAGGWQDPVIIDDRDDPADSVRATIDPAGNVTAIWRAYEGNRSTIWSNRYQPGVGWGTPVLVEDGDTYRASPRVAAAPSGHVLATWSRLGNPGEVWSSWYAPGGGWGEPMFVGTGLRGDIVVDPAGSASAVFVRFEESVPGDPNSTYETIWASRLPVGGTWSAPTQIGTGEYGSDPQLAVSPAGQVTAVWRAEYELARIGSARRTADGTWAATELLPEPYSGDQAQDGRVAMDPAGNTLIVWAGSQRIWAIADDD